MMISRVMESSEVGIKLHRKESVLDTAFSTCVFGFPPSDWQCQTSIRKGSVASAKISSRMQLCAKKINLIQYLFEFLTSYLCETLIGRKQRAKYTRKFGKSVISPGRVGFSQMLHGCTAQMLHR